MNGVDPRALALAEELGWDLSSATNESKRFISALYLSAQTQAFKRAAFAAMSACMQLNMPNCGAAAAVSQRAVLQLIESEK